MRTPSATTDAQPKRRATAISPSRSRSRSAGTTAMARTSCPPTNSAIPSRCRYSRTTRCRLGLGKEREQAGDRVRVAVDRDVPGAQRFGELAVVPDQPPPRVHVGLDGRIRLTRGPPADVDRPVGDAHVERVLAEAQLVARAQVARAIWIEERAQ